jgi:tRNA pseudouridine13 synthase
MSDSPDHYNDALAAIAVSPPRVTADLPGIGGKIKVEPEDFEVDEIPAYAPSGTGEFLYLRIEKRDMGAQYFGRQVAQRLDVPTGEIGTAGLKDRRAVTRQWVSVPLRAEPNLSRLEGDGIRVLETGRHDNKLKPGHLRGNRFRIRIRETTGDPTPLLDRLREIGLPNFYGTQRFGRDGSTLRMGLDLLRGGSGPRNPFVRKLSLSAAQSALFNAYLTRRMADRLLRRVQIGDVMGKLPYGGIFTAEDEAAEQARFDRREIVTQGPIYGTKMFLARDPAAEREAAILAEFGLARESFRGFGKLVQGTRRHNIVYLDDMTSEPVENGVVLSFTLPAGSYATVLLREVMKAEVPDEDFNASPEAQG